MKHIAILITLAVVAACQAAAERVTSDIVDRSAWRTTAVPASVPEGHPVVTISADAEERVTFIRGVGRPVLNLRCSDGERTEAFIAFGQQVTAQPRRVQWSVDDREPQEALWSHSEDWTMLMLDPGAPSIAFARALAEGKRLTVRAALGVEGVKTFSFGLDGYAKEADRLAQACGWSLVE